MRRPRAPCRRRGARDHSIYASELLSSYAAIAEHVDPSFEEILAAAERRAAALAEDEDAFRLHISR